MLYFLHNYLVHNNTNIFISKKKHLGDAHGQ